MLKYRKPISAVMTEYGWLLVTCDDGSLWYRMSLRPDDPWERFNPPVPGTAAAEAGDSESAVVREYAGTQA